MANHSRRDFMRNSVLSLAALPLGASVLSTRALAQDLPRLDPSNEQAQALNYVENAADAADLDVWLVRVVDDGSTAGEWASQASADELTDLGQEVLDLQRGVVQNEKRQGDNQAPLAAQVLVAT